MTEITCKLLMIGGGYVCAIRAGQLGVVVVVGSCLSIGFIPSKAMIRVVEEFEKAADAAAGKPFGLTAAQRVLDLKQTTAWKDGIVQRLNNGVAALLRKAKVKIVHGRARFRDGRTAQAGNDLILVIQAVGRRGVSEFSVFGLAIETGAKLQDIAGAIQIIRRGARDCRRPRSRRPPPMRYISDLVAT